ncbi:MAG: restriction endonuclease [Candidatus Binatus sp.]|jgi:restriction system protein
MPVPDFQSLMLPVLSAAKDGEANIVDVRANLAEKFRLTAEELQQLLPGGRQTTFANRIGWARTYLVKAGLLEATRRGYFRITDRGREVLKQNPARIDIAFLSKFPEFTDFRSKEREGAPSEGDSDPSLPEGTSETPDELLRATHQEIEKALRTDLLERVYASAPAFFEKVIVTLLLAMGYGGSREDAGRAIGKSGDGGLDGVIDQDPLGLDRVYIQAKRYKSDTAVSEPEIRGFAGSLESVKATKGVFVTSSYFTAPARAFAEKISRRIILIDGEQLARLMIRYGIGTRIEETFYLKKIDEDFFDND